MRGEIYGDGPERAEALRLRRRHELEDALEVHGFVTADRVHQALRRALCLVLPSRREGYGLIVVEAAAVGTPSIVVADPDNAATDLVSAGENGYVSPSARPEDLAAAIERVHAEGHALRKRTAAWFDANATRLSLQSSLERVLAAYGSDSARR